MPVRGGDDLPGQHPARRGGAPSPPATIGWCPIQRATTSPPRSPTRTTAPASTRSTRSSARTRSRAGTACAATTRVFLTGTDEYSVNIAMTAPALGKTRREFVDEMVGAVPVGRSALGIAPDRFIRTTDPDHLPRRPRDDPPRARATATSTSARTKAGTARTRGSGHRATSSRTPPASTVPNHPGVELQWLTERNWFFRLSAYQERLERYYADHPDVGPARLPAQRDARLHPPGPRGLLDQPRDLAVGHPVPDLPDGSSALLPDGSPEPGGRHGLRLVRRADQLHHRRRLSRSPGAVRAVVARRPPRHREGHQPAPHDHLAGDAHERRPALPRQVWVHGLLLAQAASG